MEREFEGPHFHVEDQRVKTTPCMSAQTHLCAVALAAEVGARGPDGLCGGATIDLMVV